MKDSLRRRILVGSVNKLTAERVVDVAPVFSRHRWFVPYVLTAAILLYVVAVGSGVADNVNRLVLAGCGAAVAGLATTRNWILVHTEAGRMLCRSSRIRQYATEVVTRFGPATRPEMLTNTVITSDWRVDGRVYTATKRSEQFLRSWADE